MSDGGLWQTAVLTCVICGHTQVSTFPVEVPGLECGKCGYMNRVPDGRDEPELA